MRFSFLYAIMCIPIIFCLFANVSVSSAFDLSQERLAVQTLCEKLAKEKTMFEAAYRELAEAIFVMADEQRKGGEKDETATPAMLAAGKKLTVIVKAIGLLKRELHERQATIMLVEEADLPDASMEQKYGAANALSFLIPYASPSEAEALQVEADARFQTVLKTTNELGSDFYRLWANSVRAFAGSVPEAKRPGLYAKSASLYAQSLKQAQDAIEESVALFNWGHLLQQMGSEKTGNAQADLFRQADVYYTQATSKGGSWHLWGDALIKRSQFAKGADRDALYREALRLYAKSAEVREDGSSDGFIIWSRVLLEYGMILHREKREQESSALFVEASIVLSQIETTDSACLRAKAAALLDQEKECREFMHICSQNGLSGQLYIEELESGLEWAKVRETPWFRLSLVKLQMQEAESRIH